MIGNMNIRKIKKELKKPIHNDIRHTGLMSLQLIRRWSKINHYNSKSNMRILTQNFYRNKKFLS